MQITDKSKYERHGYCLHRIGNPIADSTIIISANVPH